VRYVLLAVVDAVAYVRRTEVDKRPSRPSAPLLRKRFNSSTGRVDEFPHWAFVVGGPT